MRTSAPIHVELRQKTALLHQRVEEQLDLLGPDLTIERYRRVLRALYGFYAPVEAELVRLQSATPPLRFLLPARTLLLERDLVTLGASPHEASGWPRCSGLPTLSRPEQLAGCLYVVEGAALGGQVISRALARTLDIGKEHGAAFFAGDGDNTAARWKRFLAWLDESFPTKEGIGEVVGAACETFGALERWLRAQGASR